MTYGTLRRPSAKNQRFPNYVASRERSYEQRLVLSLSFNWCYEPSVIIKCASCLSRNYNCKLSVLWFLLPCFLFVHLYNWKIGNVRVDVFLRYASG